MEKDPHIVARLAAERQEENWRLRTLLKQLTPVTLARVDRLAEEFGRAAEAEIECTSCGVCCWENWVPVSTEEEMRLASRLGISCEEFRGRYVSKDDNGEPAIEATPCPFLDGKRCSVYEDRPDACRGYPYVGGNLSSRVVGIIERAGTCPIVFEMLERLKDAVWTGGGRERKRGGEGETGRGGEEA